MGSGELMGEQIVWLSVWKRLAIILAKYNVHFENYTWKLNIKI